MIPAIGVVAHRDRYRKAARMADYVGAEFITVDDGGLGAGRNHELCYEWLAESDAPWSVVMEDDAIPVRDFRDQVTKVLRAVKTDILSLYLGRSRPPHYQMPIAQVIGSDSHFLLARELLHHVAVAIRTSLIPEMLDFIRAQPRYVSGKLPIDEVIGMWTRSRSTPTPIAYCHPSIVNHDAEIETLIKKHPTQHRNDNGERPPGLRKAWAFGVRDNWEFISADIPEPVTSLSSRRKR